MKRNLVKLLVGAMVVVTTVASTITGANAAEGNCNHMINVPINTQTLGDSQVNYETLWSMERCASWKDNGWMLPWETYSYLYNAVGTQLYDDLQSGKKMVLSMLWSTEDMNINWKVTDNTENEPIICFSIQDTEGYEAYGLGVGAKTGTVYRIPHQGGQSIYRMEAGNKVKEYKYR